MISSPLTAMFSARSPNSLARRSVMLRLADSISVLLGMQPAQDAKTAHHSGSFDHRRLQPQLRRRARARVAGASAADHHKVKVKLLFAHL